MSNRIMAIDYGDAHTGIAISDLTGFMAGFTTVIHTREPDILTGEILSLTREYEISALILGCPLNMDGSKGPRAEKAEEFAERLKIITGLPVTLWDERRTTIDAHNILAANGKNAKKRKKTVDAVAAALILENYLNYLNNKLK